MKSQDLKLRTIHKEANEILSIICCIIKTARNNANQKS